MGTEEPIDNPIIRSKIILIQLQEMLFEFLFFYSFFISDKAVKPHVGIHQP